MKGKVAKNYPLTILASADKSVKLLVVSTRWFKVNAVASATLLKINTDWVEF